MAASVSCKVSDVGRNIESPSCGLAKPEKEGRMSDKEKLMENINKMMDRASESQIRIFWIVAQQVLKK